MSTAAITAIVIAVLVLIAFGGGFALGDWRMANKVRLLESDKSVLQAANDACATDIQTVNGAYATLQAAATAKEKSADTAMLKAQPQAAKHTARAIAIRAQPAVMIDKQCAAIAEEQILYVQTHNSE